MRGLQTKRDIVGSVVQLDFPSVTHWGVVGTSSKLQPDWPSIADWAYVGIFAVKIRFHIRDQFWIPQPKLHGACILDFVEKSKNELVWSFLRFLTILAKNQ